MEEPGARSRARGSQEHPGATRRSLEQPGGATRGPPHVWGSDEVLLIEKCNSLVYRMRVVILRKFA